MRNAPVKQALKAESGSAGYQASCWVPGAAESHRRMLHTSSNWSGPKPGRCEPMQTRHSARAKASSFQPPAQNFSNRCLFQFLLIETAEPHTLSAEIRVRRLKVLVVEDVCSGDTQRPLKTLKSEITFFKKIITKLDRKMSDGHKLPEKKIAMDQFPKYKIVDGCNNG